MVAADTCDTASTSSVNDHWPGPHVGSLSLTANETAAQLDAPKGLDTVAASTGSVPDEVPSKRAEPSDDADGVWVIERVIVTDDDWLRVSVCVVDCEGVAVGVRPVVTVCVAEGLRDGDDVALGDIDCVAVTDGEREGVNDPVCACDAVCE